MKTTRLKTSLFSALACLLLCFPSCTKGSVTDITKPHLGEYECQSATLGERDYMEEFAYIKLELREDNTFYLYYKPTEGEKGEETGVYEYDKEKKTICFSLRGREEFKRCFPIDKGQITLTFPIGAKQFCMKFEQK